MSIGHVLYVFGFANHTSVSLTLFELATMHSSILVRGLTRRTLSRAQSRLVSEKGRLMVAFQLTWQF